MLALGRHLEDAGDKERLTELLTARVDTLPVGAARVQAYTLLTEGVVRGNADIRGLLEKALAEAGDDPTLRAQVLPFLAEHEAVDEVRHVARADDRATEAVALSELGSADDQALAVHSLTWTQALRGRPVAHLVERYHALTPQRSYMARHPERVAGQRLTWRGELAEGRALIGDYRDRAEEWAEAYALARLHLCELELRAGGWSEVQRMLDEWAESTDNDLLQWPMYERCRALLAAGRGDVEDAPALGEQRGVAGRVHRRALGLAGGQPRPRPGGAARQGPGGRGRPPRRRVGPHAAGGRAGPRRVPGRPRTWSRPWPRRRRTTPRRRWSTCSPSGRASRSTRGPARARQRGAALIEIHGDAYTDAAGDALEAAAATYGGLGLAFDEARTLLALGRAQRRAKKWGAARDVLERTVAAFEAIGSPGWADDARAELERVGARKPATSGGLTATERRVADLAVEGLANKEIARTLVVTVNTVEFHLRNAYAKLGIRSRVQLAARLQEVDGPVPE